MLTRSCLLYISCHYHDWVKRVLLTISVWINSKFPKYIELRIWSDNYETQKQNLYFSERVGKEVGLAEACDCCVIPIVQNKCRGKLGRHWYWPLEVSFRKYFQIQSLFFIIPGQILKYQNATFLKIKLWNLSCSKHFDCCR